MSELSEFLVAPVGPESRFGPRFGAYGEKPYRFSMAKTSKSSKLNGLRPLNLLASDMDPFDIPWQADEKP